MTTRKPHVRKKLTLNELATNTFSIDLTLSTNDTDAILDQFTNKLESIGLCYCGVTNGTRTQGYVMGQNNQKSPNSIQRIVIRQWADNHPLIKKADIGPLADN